MTEFIKKVALKAPSSVPDPDILNEMLQQLLQGHLRSRLGNNGFRY